MKLRGLLKGLFFFLRLHIIFEPLAKVMRFVSGLSAVSKWISQHSPNVKFNDFYTFKRDYDKRYSLYEHVRTSENLQEFDYLEFGVASGLSLKWWTANNKNPNARFYGFDTFTGLPEDWGPYKAGDMNFGPPPQIADDRISFQTGLFQQTLPTFIKEHSLDRRLVLMMDADLYSSTLYVLTSLAPYLKKGDIIFFDEFNVPAHEYLAFTDFVRSYYLKYEVIGAVSNFYQVAIKVL
jgi:O-methyltransferase